MTAGGPLELLEQLFTAEIFTQVRVALIDRNGIQPTGKRLFALAVKRIKSARPRLKISALLHPQPLSCRTAGVRKRRKSAHNTCHRAIPASSRSAYSGFLKSSIRLFPCLFSLSQPSSHITLRRKSDCYKKIVEILQFGRSVCLCRPLRGLKGGQGHCFPRVAYAAWLLHIDPSGLLIGAKHRLKNRKLRPK